MKQTQSKQESKCIAHMEQPIGESKFLQTHQCLQHGDLFPNIVPSHWTSISQQLLLIGEIVVHKRYDADKYKYKQYQTARARNAPAVPGAIGTNPVPKPVDRTT